MPRLRHLVLALGDQLDARSAAFDGFDPCRDRVWMAEVHHEATAVWSHKARIALFLSAMRHFREEIQARGWKVDYRQLDHPENRGSFSAELADAIRRDSPAKVIVVEPGEWRVREELRTACEAAGAPLEIRADQHFLCSVAEFAEYAQDRKQLRLEYFYRFLRRRHGILMNGEEPAGGQWNYDADNRASFPKSGPGKLPPPVHFAPDPITLEVMRLVEERFASHPGSLRHFGWAVTAAQAQEALRDFIGQRLPRFGEAQDAMWTGEPFLYHSLLSACLNLKLLNPRDVIAQAVEAWESGAAPLSAVEGFVRQILGWREYVRGIYWTHMPGYASRNALQAHLPLPSFFWNGETEMNCLRHTIGQTLDYGYAHHIQRLMVTGLYALLLGVKPEEVHRWYLAVYVDAVEWVELPNTIGMSQFADGGVMASKPYAASGKYIQRMSNYCQGCRFHPAEAIGENACPFTTLYWDFLMRHEKTLSGNRRMDMQLRNLVRITPARRQAIRQQAQQHRESVACA